MVWGSASSGGGSGSTGEGIEAIDRETVFGILSNRRRRYVLQYLRGNGGESDIRSLSERIAAWENDREIESVTAKERKRVYTALHQSHLPRLARAGVVRYDPDRGTVELTGAIDEFEVYLDVVPRSERDWGRVYLGIGVLGTAVAGLVTFDVFPFTLLPPVAYLFLFGVTVLAVGGVHTYTRARGRGGDEALPDARSSSGTSQTD